MKAISDKKKAEVKVLRKQGMTHRQIAQIAGISECSVSNILRGRTHDQNRCSNIPYHLWNEWDHITSEIRKKAYTGAR